MEKEMKPGPQLDRAVAEKVMGIPQFPETGDGWADLASMPDSYSTSMLSAWKVVEKIGEKYMVRIMGGGVSAAGPFKTWNVEVFDHPGVAGGLFVSAGGETAPHAICLAALEMMSIQ